MAQQKFSPSLAAFHWVSDKGAYHIILKVSHGAYIFQRTFLRGLSTEGNLRFKIYWASLTVGRKFTVFALFYFVFEGNFQVQAPGGLIFGGAINGGYSCILCYDFRGLYLEGLIHGGAYFGILR